jgi:hypothetical protein
MLLCNLTPTQGFSHNCYTCFFVGIRELKYVWNATSKLHLKTKNGVDWRLIRHVVLLLGNGYVYQGPFTPLLRDVSMEL